MMTAIGWTKVYEKGFIIKSHEVELGTGYYRSDHLANWTVLEGAECATIFSTLEEAKEIIELSNLEHATITEIIRTTEYQLLQIGIKK